MTARLTLALVGDRDERITAHRAIEAALPLAARSLGVVIDAHWLSTDCINNAAALRGAVTMAFFLALRWLYGRLRGREDLAA